MTEKHTDKRTILIVDDDADLSMLIQDMLEDNGYAFLYAASIDDAYAVSYTHLTLPTILLV